MIFSTKWIFKKSETKLQKQKKLFFS